MSSVSGRPTVGHMARAAYPWYRAWRGWRTSRRPTSEPMVRARWKVLPFITFVAAAALAALFLYPSVVAVVDNPPKIETAVKSEWFGGPYPFGIGNGQSAPETAEEVRCEQTDATVGGARAYECTIVYDDYNETDGS
jgi:hypothetical protein